MVIFHWSFSNVSFSVIIHEQLCHVNFYGWCQIERYFHQISSRNLDVGGRCPKEKTGRQRWLHFKTIIKMSKASDQIWSFCFQFSEHRWRSSEHQKSKALLKAHRYQSPCPSKNENKETNTGWALPFLLSHPPFPSISAKPASIPSAAVVWFPGNLIKYLFMFQPSAVQWQEGQNFPHPQSPLPHPEVTASEQGWSLYFISAFFFNKGLKNTNACYSRKQSPADPPTVQWPTCPPGFSGPLWRGQLPPQPPGPCSCPSHSPQAPPLSSEAVPRPLPRG